MNNKIFTFLLLISVLWVGTHFITDLIRYTKEYDNSSWMDKYYWSGYSTGFGILHKIFGRMTVVFS